MKKDFKEVFLSIYAGCFLIFSFFSSCFCMCELLMKIPFLHNIDRMYEIVFTAVFFLHIGTGLLILSGRLKPKD